MLCFCNAGLTLTGCRPASQLNYFIHLWVFHEAGQELALWCELFSQDLCSTIGLILIVGGHIFWFRTRIMNSIAILVVRLGVLFVL